MQGTSQDFLDLLDYYETDPVFRKKELELGFVPKKEWIAKMEEFKMKCQYPKERRKNPGYCKNMKTKHW